MVELEKNIEKLINLLTESIVQVKNEEESSEFIAVYELEVRKDGKFFYKFLRLKKRIYKLLQDYKDKQNYNYVIFKLFQLTIYYKERHYKVSLFLAKLIYKLLNLHISDYYFSLQDVEFLCNYLCEEDEIKFMSNLETEIEKPYVFDKHDENYYNNCIRYSTN